MNNQQRALIESALELLHRVIGMDDAINDFAVLQRGKFRIEVEHHAEQNANTPPPERAGALFIGENRGIVTFTEKEILSMPKEKRNYFRANGLRVFYRKKKNGVFEIRCTINKVPYYGAAKDLKLAKARFLEDLNRGPKATSPTTSTIPRDVAAYSLHFLEVFKKPNVNAKTFKNYENVNRLHIAGRLGDKLIRDVTASDCHVILRELRDAGKKRTAEEVRNLLN